MLTITPSHNSCRTKRRKIDYHTWCFPAVLRSAYCTGLLLDKKIAESHLSFQYWVIMILGNKLWSAVCLLFSTKQGVEGEIIITLLWLWLYEGDYCKMIILLQLFDTIFFPYAADNLPLALRLFWQLFWQKSKTEKKVVFKLINALSWHLSESTIKILEFDLEANTIRLESYMVSVCKVSTEVGHKWNKV